MARTIATAGHYVQTSIGALESYTVSNGITVATFVRFTTIGAGAQNNQLFQCQTSGSAQLMGFEVGGSDSKLYLEAAAADTHSTSTVTTGKWYLLVATKAGGNVAGRF